VVGWWCVGQDSAERRTIRSGALWQGWRWGLSGQSLHPGVDGDAAISDQVRGGVPAVEDLGEGVRHHVAGPTLAMEDDGASDSVDLADLGPLLRVIGGDPAGGAELLEHVDEMVAILQTSVSGIASGLGEVRSAGLH